MPAPSEKLTQHQIVCVLAMLLLCRCVYGQTPSLTLSSGSTTKGGSISLNLSLNAPSSMPAGLQWTLAYPAADVTSLTAVAGPALTAAGKVLVCNSGAGTMVCLAAGVNATTIASGVVAVVTAALSPSSGSTLDSLPMSNALGTLPDGTNANIAGTGATISVAQPALPAVSNLQCSTTTLLSLSSSTCTVTLSGAAPSGGALVTLTDTSLSLTVPTSVTVSTNATSATFIVATLALGTSGSATITATYNGTSANTTLGLAASGPVSGSATFLRTDTTTQGNWRGAYGTDGYAVAGDQTSNPGYVSPVMTGQLTYLWASSTTDVRGLQKPSNPADRIAATWYNTTPFTIDLNISDTAQHQIALYCLDWDSGSRQETVDILDGNGNVLNTQRLTTSFVGGVYLVWNVSGHVQIRVSWTAGWNAVVSGLFFDTTGTGVTFVKTDTATKGNWRGVYGNDGYAVAGDQTGNPGYVSPIMTGQLTYLWAGSTSDVRGLQKPSNPADRIAATWYNTTPFTIDLNISDTAQHQIALYCLDWDSGGRQETVDILDGNGNVLNTQRLTTSFVGGVYLVWNVSGHVQIRVSWTAGWNAVVSGLFFDAAGGGVTFLKTDTATKGNWRGVYGTDGYAVAGDQTSNPGYVSPVMTGQLTYLWAGSTTDVRGLQKPSNPNDRIAATWYNTTPFTIDLNISGTASHQIALYCLDWDTVDRKQTVDILDGNGNVLNTQRLTSFNGGVYLVWNVSGHVQIRVSWTAGWNGVVSGLFFDPTTAGVPPTTAMLPARSMQTAATALGSSTSSFGSQSAVSSIVCSPRVAMAGSQVSCELRVSASERPLQLALTSASDQVKLPAFVVTRPNQSSLTFQASVDPIAKQQTAMVSATLGDSRVEDAIMVAPRTGPMLTAPPKLKAAWGAPLSFTVTAADPDKQPVQLAASRLPDGASFDATSGVLTWIPNASQQGQHSITFTATNWAHQTAFAETTLAVGSGTPALTNPQKLDCSPNAITAVTGEWLAPAGRALSGPSGGVMELGGVAVKINGEAVPVLFSSATQVRFLCPVQTPGVPLSLVVDAPSGRTEALTGTMQAATPRILSFEGSDQQGLISFAGAPDLAMERNYRTAAHPAQPGDELVVWATGLGATGVDSSGALQVKIGGVNAVVVSVQPVSGQVGVSAIQILVPAGIPVGDEVPVQMELATADSVHVISNVVTAAFESVRQ